MTTTLALETSTDACCVCVKVRDRTAQRVIVEARVHARVIMREIREVLSELDCRLDEVDRVVFGNGPGSFTGVRIAVALAQGIASGRKVPVLGVSSLRVIAQSALIADPSISEISIVQDARLGEAYFGNYRRGEHGLAIALAPDSLIAPNAAGDQLLATATGSGIEAFPDLRQHATEKGVRLLESVVPQPLALLAIAEGGEERWQPAAAATAAYLREIVADKMSERG